MPSKESLELLVQACEDEITEASEQIARAERSGDAVEWARGHRVLADAQLRAQQCQTNIMGPQQRQAVMLPWDNPAWHDLKPQQQEGVAKQLLTPPQLEAAKICNVDPVTYAKNLAKLLEAKGNGDYPDRQTK